MADQKTTELTQFTPAINDVLYGVDDPGGTPASGKLTIDELLDLYASKTATLTNKSISAGQITSPGGIDTDAIHDNVAGEISAVTEKASPVGADLLIIEDSADSNNKKRVQLTNLPGSGETNTASNVGTAGVGIFKQKTGVDIELKKLNAGSSKVTITDDTGNDEVDIDLAQGNIDHDALLNFVANEHIDWTSDQGATDINAGNIPDGSDGSAVHDNVAGEIVAVTEKTAPVGADEILIEDSENSNNKKSLKLENISNFLASYGFLAEDLLSPNNAGWQVNALAPLTADPDNLETGVRLFDDTTEEGVGARFFVPAGSKNMKLVFVSKAKTAPGSAKTVDMRFYFSKIDGAPTWSSAKEVTHIDIPTSTNYVLDSQTFSLSTISMTAGSTYNLELIRYPSGTDDLVGDWALAYLGVIFT